MARPSRTVSPSAIATELARSGPIAALRALANVLAVDLDEAPNVNDRTRVVALLRATLGLVARLEIAERKAQSQPNESGRTIVDELRSRRSRRVNRPDGA
jgi:hypothetical protein